MESIENLKITSKIKLYINDKKEKPWLIDQFMGEVPFLSDFEEDVHAEDIMTKNVISLPVSTTLTEVIDLMYHQNISSIVIGAESLENVSIIAHSDIITYLHDHPVLECSLGEISAKLIARPIKVVPYNLHVDELIRLMQLEGLKRVLVGKNNNIIGIISVRDLLTWNSRSLAKSLNIFLMVIENQTGLMIAKHDFKEGINMDLIDLFSGSLSAIDSIMREILKRGGRLRIIQKQYFALLLESFYGDKLTAVLVVDRPSIDARRRLISFCKQFEESFSEILKRRIAKGGGISDFKIDSLIQIFEYKERF